MPSTLRSFTAGWKGPLQKVGWWRNEERFAPRGRHQTLISFRGLIIEGFPFVPPNQLTCNK